MKENKERKNHKQHHILWGKTTEQDKTSTVRNPSAPQVTSTHLNNRNKNKHKTSNDLTASTSSDVEPLKQQAPQDVERLNNKRRKENYVEDKINYDTRTKTEKRNNNSS